MNKAELVDSISAIADVTKTDAQKVLEAFIETVTYELGKGSEVTLVGFGVFSVKECSERKGRNPQTGEELVIAASKKPSFKAGKGLKDAVNGN